MFATRATKRTEIQTPISVMTLDYCDRVLSNQRLKQDNQEQFIYCVSTRTQIKLGEKLMPRTHLGTSAAALLCAEFALNLGQSSLGSLGQNGVLLEQRKVHYSDFQAR